MEIPASIRVYRPIHREESPVRIEVKGRNLQVTDELRETVARRFEKVGKQVSELAQLDIELYEERNPANPQQMVAEATLHLKGTTLRAKNASRDAKHSINLVADELARQVKRHRDKRRKRRESRALAAQGPPPGAEAEEAI
jgi:putative sigma-54 modulation protein